jgi:hypothetical protein
VEDSEVKSDLRNSQQIRSLSIRAWQWDLGVLRAVGVTRWEICQLVLSEAILVGLSTCALSLGFGVMADYCGTGAVALRRRSWWNGDAASDAADVSGT